jgi:hypothetical protein
MKRGWWLVIAVLVALVLVWVLRGGARKAPDEKLAAHGRALCAIAEKGERAPRDGVRALMRYYGDHAPAMARDWAELIVLIERIDDDRAHDDRARLAGKRIREPLERCQSSFERFGRAIEADPEAAAILDRGVKRLSRTFELIFGPAPKSGASPASGVSPAFPAVPGMLLERMR